MAYQISFRHWDQILWTLETDNLHTVAGMLAVSMPLAREMGEGYYFTTQEDVSAYRLRSNRSLEETTDLEGLPEEGMFLWIASSQLYRYNLFFCTNLFVQGLITLCQNAQVDFRNYILGYPFDSAGNLYSLAGYVMTSDNTVVVAPDLDDIEEDEEDDETVINPLGWYEPEEYFWN